MSSKPISSGESEVISKAKTGEFKMVVGTSFDQNVGFGFQRRASSFEKKNVEIMRRKLKNYESFLYAGQGID